MLGMPGHCVLDVTFLQRSIPGRDDGPAPREPLQHAERVLMQCELEEELDVVQQDGVTPGLGDDPIEKRRDSNGPLPLGQVEKAAGEARHRR